MKSANNPLELTSLETRSIRSAFSSHEYPDGKIETPFHYGTPSTLIREGRNQETSTQQNPVLLGQHSRRKVTFPTWLPPKTKTSKTKRGQKEVLSTQYWNLEGGGNLLNSPCLRPPASKAFYYCHNLTQFMKKS